MVKEHQQEYYETIASSDKASNSSTFILFMLQCIRKTIDEISTPKKTPKDVILELIASDAKVTVEQMAEALGMNKRNAQKHINQLVNDGVIVRIGTNRGAVREILAARERVLRLEDACFRRPMGMARHVHAVAIVRAPKAVPVGAPQCGAPQVRNPWKARRRSSAEPDRPNKNSKKE